MIAALLMLLLGAPAQAHDSHLHGSYRVHSIVKDEVVVPFPDALAEEGKELVYGRWLWVFEDKKLMMSSQVLHKVANEPGKNAIRDEDYDWCSSSVRLDVGWSKGTLMMPPALQSAASVGRYDKAGSPISVQGCQVRLAGVGALTAVKNAEGTPDNSITLVDATGKLKFVLVPDNVPVDVDGMIR